MNKILKMCIGIFIWLIILAIGAGVFIGLSMTPEDWNTTSTENHSTVLTPTVVSTTTAIPTPVSTPKETTSKDGFTIDDVREFDSVTVRFLSYKFDMKGEVKWTGERYTTCKCHGWNEDHDVYAYIVSNNLASFISINHGYGSTEYDYEVSDLLWKNMIKNSREIS